MVKFLFFEKATISCWSAKGTRTLVSCIKVRCCISPSTPLLFVLLHKGCTTSWICTDSWRLAYIMRCRPIQYQELKNWMPYSNMAPIHCNENWSLAPKKPASALCFPQLNPPACHVLSMTLRWRYKKLFITVYSTITQRVTKRCPVNSFMSFFKGGLWGKSFLGCRELFCCRVAVGLRNNLATRLQGCAVSSSLQSMFSVFTPFC